MTFHDTLCLLQAGRTIRTFPLTEAAVEVGSHPDCDVTVHATRVPERALLVQPCGGTVYVYDLVEGPGLRERTPMPMGEPWSIGAGYSVTRLKTHTPTNARGTTEVIRPRPTERPSLSLVTGAGVNSRAFHIGDAAVSVGGAGDNVIRISDRAVSQYHCRIEPSARAVLVRDLGSTNGTWVDGIRVRHQELRSGAVVRIGRTELRTVDRKGMSVKGIELVTEAAPMLAVMADVDRFARLSWPVLIRGETGVGKEHVARALHERGPRRDAPFVALNGGGLPRELIESELFGHERGAFTGALQARRGAFEQAHRGTLFLDEVAELPLELQTRLLRVLETWQVRRLGGEQDRPIDVRLVCATHSDLRDEVRAGRFRTDLFYRIHRLVVEVPPLRARPNDIEPLARHFLAQMESQVGKRELGREVLGRLQWHRWPGNVRELRNVLELAAVDCDGALIDLAAIERSLRRTGEAGLAAPSTDMLREALEHYGGNVSAAARALGMPRSTLRDRLKSDPETAP